MLHTLWPNNQSGQPSRNQVVSSRNQEVSACHAVVASRNCVVSSCHAVVASRNRRSLESQPLRFRVVMLWLRVATVWSRVAMLSFSCSRADSDTSVQIILCIQAQIK